MVSASDRARDIGIKIAAKYADEVDRDARFPKETIDALKEQELLSLLIPRSLGGGGGSLLEVAEVCWILAQYCSSSAMILAMHYIMTASMLEYEGLESWPCLFMMRVAADQLLLASATSEAGIGGALRNSICAIKSDGTNFTLEKDATVISYGAQADGIMVTARRCPEAATTDQVMVALLKGQYGLERTAQWNTLGMRGTCSDGFKLTAKGPIEQILPRPFAEIAAQSMLSTSHLLWACVWLGIATDAVARARSYVRSEAQKNRNGTSPGTMRLVEATNLLQMMKANLLLGLSDCIAAQEDEAKLMSFGFGVAMNNIKISASQSVIQIVNHALMICGIHGYKNDTAFSVGRHMRDALSAPLMINNDRIMGNMSEMILGHRPAKGLMG
ncbi:acyl-CoA dehydrogenase family protein [Dongia soli]|uniref:Acyl-CoA dehydrogenase family protein n=1 Tax=Dongia soli TaxID=600628 RepID=A0ABU5EDW7_9PROT|nr:acyl-CoA dehydrogenase family protein [Dongia soli]MDY0884250.1 acyl-CoA dehydrogenase family protein [Dongia soli]